VLYAVLLSFATVVVWQKFSDAEVDDVQEAGAATTLYRLSQGVGEKPGADLRDAVTVYLKTAITDDWPAMQAGVAAGASRPRTRRSMPSMRRC
jgi:hypothetical protein